MLFFEEAFAVNLSMRWKPNVEARRENTIVRYETRIVIPALAVASRWQHRWRLTITVAAFGSYGECYPVIRGRSSQWRQSRA